MKNQIFYSRAAGLYDINLALNGYRRAARHIIGKLPFNTFDTFTVLDAGCGTGLYARAILDRFPNAHVVAFDLNSEMIEIAKKNIESLEYSSRAELFVGDVSRSIPQELHSFDLIITGGVLEHVDAGGAIRNLATYLKPQGLFLNSPVRNNWIGRLIGRQAGFAPYSRASIIASFSKEGLELKQDIKIPHRYFPISVIKDVQLFLKK